MLSLAATTDMLELIIHNFKNSLGIELFKALKMNVNLKSTIEKFSNIDYSKKNIKEDNYSERIKDLKQKRHNILNTKRNNDKKPNSDFQIRSNL